MAPRGTMPAPSPCVALELDKLQDELRAAGGRWNAGLNLISSLAPLERRGRLGGIRGGADLGLERRGSAARLRRARQRELPGHAREAHDLRALDGRDFVGPVREHGARSACVAAICTVAEVTARIAAGDPRLELAKVVLDITEIPPEGGPCDLPSPLTFELRDGGPSTSDRADRRIHVRGWRELMTVEAMKSWLMTRGPLITVLAVHEDFYAYMNGVYHHVIGALEGGHHVAVIGFDDGGEYWIAQNSWGPRWGEDGAFRIGFGERGIDASMWGLELQ